MNDVAIPAVVTELIDKLQPQLGKDAVVTGGAIVERAAGIWRSDTVVAAAIFRPATVEQVATVLRECHAVGQSVITHGGLTGLVEGAITKPTDVVLSTERLNKIESVSVVDRTMVVQSGVTLQAAQERAAADDLMLAMDLGARGSCTIGGNVATNAGGHQVIRYGMMRDAVLGVEAVLADGTIVSSLNAMLKNNAGYDLKQLFIGTEGTLGVVTRVVLRLRPAWRSQETALVACKNFADICALLRHLDESLGGNLSAFELFWQNYYQLVAADGAFIEPIHPYYALVEALGAEPGSDRERFLAALETASDKGLLADAVVCKSGKERQALWDMRDSVDKTLKFGEAYIFDVSLRLSAMEAYVAEVLVKLEKDIVGSRTWVFGHAGDGNLHFVVAPGKQAGSTARARVEAIIYEPLRELGGSVSGEHGIGLEKKAWLSVSRNDTEIELMRRLKTTLDPQGILNPGRVIDT